MSKELKNIADIERVIREHYGDKWDYIKQTVGKNWDYKFTPKGRLKKFEIRLLNLTIEVRTNNLRNSALYKRWMQQGSFAGITHRKPKPFAMHLFRLGAKQGYVDDPATDDELRALLPSLGKWCWRHRVFTRLWNTKIFFRRCLASSKHRIVTYWRYINREKYLQSPQQVFDTTINYYTEPRWVFMNLAGISWIETTLEERKFFGALYKSKLFGKERTWQLKLNNHTIVMNYNPAYADLYKDIKYGLPFVSIKYARDDNTDEDLANHHVATIKDFTKILDAIGFEDYK